MRINRFTIASWCMAVVLVLSLGVQPQTIGQENSDFKSSIKKTGGVETVEFDTLVGTVEVNFPDDMSDTDTISGTVLVEPKGETKEEIAQNEDTLRGYVVEIEKTIEVPEPPEKPPAKPPAKPPCGAGTIATRPLPPATCPPRKPNPPPKCPPGGTSVKSGGTCTGEGQPPTIYVVPGCRGGFTAAVPPKCGGVRVVVKNSGGTTICALPVPTNPIPPKRPPGCKFPPTCNAGGPLCIPGPSDGRSSTTNVKVNGLTCPPICESPRVVIAQVPGTVRGPCTVTLTECGQTRRGTTKVLPPKTSPPQPPATKPNTPGAKGQLVFRRTGPFVTAPIEFKGYENEGYQYQVVGNQIIFDAIDDKKPVRAIVNFTPPPEFITPGDSFTVTASVDGPDYDPPLSGPRGCYYPDFNWIKNIDSQSQIPNITANPRRDRGDLSASWTYNVLDYEAELAKRRAVIKQHAAKATATQIAQAMASLDEQEKKQPSLEIAMMSMHYVHVKWIYVPDHRKGAK